MTSLSHFGTCRVWSTGNWNDCDCQNDPPWRIRKEPEELFAWRIWRLTGDGVYVHVMRCSTWDGAMALVDQFVWLGRNTLIGETNA